MFTNTKIFLHIQTVICISVLCNGLEYNKQREQNANTDFLLHESGTLNLNPTSSRKQNDISLLSDANTLKKQSQTPPVSPVIRDYVSQFPALKPLQPTPAISTPTPTTAKSGANHASAGKRDFVNPNFPPLPSKSHSSQTTEKLGTTQDKSPKLTTIPTSGKRDYVNPQFQNGPGRVKDLVNFYDNKNVDQTGTNKPPSYSSILQGNKISTPPPVPVGTTGNVSPTTKGPTGPSTSNRVSNPNKPNHTTQKPTRTPVVLPSTINNNKNNQANGNIPSDDELQTLSEELLRKDTNNAVRYITINYQEKTTSQSNEDKAPQPLLSIAPDAWNIPTVQKFLPLLDNYVRDTLVNEYVTPQEKNEENAFMDAIMTTNVIRHLMNFLKDKGYVTPDPRQQRDFLKQIWFNLYSRGKGKLSSSGFEHVFLSELKNGEIIGLHNWIYFSKEEQANHANYLGYMKYLQLSDKGVVLKLHFSQEGISKPVNTMFIGTSPELEIALYTLCFVTRADNDCRLRLGTKYVDIITHTFRYRSKNHVGSAYPQI